ncbi:hypothetical protein LINGRAHAP2_LOCUS27043 [Linum grandiflorum]
MTRYDLAEEESNASVDPISLILPRIVTGSKLPPPAPNSPRFGLWMKKKFRHASPRQLHQAKISHETHLRRSKSCAEGRSSGVDELYVWFKNPDKPDAKSSSSGTKKRKEEEEFKCGVLCLYLPGFGGGKVKPVTERKEEVIISRTMSLEKFECGSWASSGIINGEVEDSSTRFYYDLLMEMIRLGGNEMDSPVTAGFVFENDRKGVLKKQNGSTTPNRKSSEESSSARQVWFSRSASNPSSPAMCITPRLRKAREEFNAFLEAEARTT